MNQEIDTRNTDEIVCPHCGHTQADSFEYIRDGDECFEIDCEECGKEFAGEGYFSVSFTTRKK